MKTERLFFFSCLLWFVSSTYGIAQTDVIETIFIADYENNTTNSGLTGINATNASATDAVYMVSGNESNYAVAHKVDRTDNTYFSNGSFRSESDVLDFSAANYRPGDHFRYEFSVYLKDWEEYIPGAAPYADNLFQMKETEGVVTRIATKRNGLFVWEPASSQNTLITDIRPYVNQWIDFKIDVLWTKGETGYIKYHIRFPGDELYTLVRFVENIITYYGTATQGQRGYFKWGVYREANATSTDTPDVRIAYHDNIKLFRLDDSSLKTETKNDKEAFQAKIYPNPSNGSVKIDLPATIENADIYIYNLDGKTLFKKQLHRNEENSISISHLDSGLYFLKIVYEGNFIVKKLIRN